MQARLKFFWPVFVLLIGCSNYDDQLKQQAEITGAAQAQRQIDATNTDLETKSKAMQTDLDTRQRFYQSVAGTYEGLMDGGKGAYQKLHTRFTLVPSLPPYHTDRVRTLEEITADLNNLHLSVEVVQWDDETNAAFGCVFGNIQPDLTRGLIQLIAPDCPNAFTLWLGADHASSANLASQLLNSKIMAVPALTVEMDPTRASEIYHFTVQKDPS